MIHVYDADGKEIAPSDFGIYFGSTRLQTVAGQDSITVTVVGVSGGVADLTASWNVWSGNDGNSSYTPWHWTTNQSVEITALGPPRHRLEQRRVIDHATDDPVETQYPGACLAYYSGHPEELSDV